MLTYKVNIGSGISLGSRYQVYEIRTQFEGTQRIDSAAYEGEESPQKHRESSASVINPEVRMNAGASGR